ncbi:hypothetical protein [uncultured Maribacter sp.]|uniref:hypothetical protein n=1 Tax=uncultured Maribacter sp. TaxID=431308 RepID=UPI0030EF4260
MKSPNQIFRVLLLVSIYCFGVYSSANSLPFSNEISVDQKNEQKTYFTASTKLLSPHSQQSEVSISDVTENVTPNFKLPFASVSISLKSNEVLFNSKYKQYQNYANTLLIRHRKTDLIFPFHNFW